MTPKKDDSDFCRQLGASVLFLFCSGADITKDHEAFYNGLRNAVLEYLNEKDNGNKGGLK